MLSPDALSRNPSRILQIACAFQTRTSCLARNLLPELSMANAARLEQLAGTTNFYCFQLTYCCPRNLELAKGFEPPTA
jgi:hypothetical protein